MHLSLGINIERFHAPDGLFHIYFAIGKQGTYEQGGREEINMTPSSDFTVKFWILRALSAPWGGEDICFQILQQPISRVMKLTTIASKGWLHSKSLMQTSFTRYSRFSFPRTRGWIVVSIFVLCPVWFRLRFLMHTWHYMLITTIAI